MSSYCNTTFSRPSTSASSTFTSQTRSRTARPRTAASTFNRQNIICAITESRGVSATVGLCFINTTAAECIISEIVDTQTYVHTLQKLQVHDPIEILAPATSFTPRQSTLVSLIQQYFPQIPITQLPRKYFNEQAGNDYISSLCVPSLIPSILTATSGKFYSISACAAALKHVELSYTRFAAHTLRMRYQPSEGSVLIDFATVHSLELVSNVADPKGKKGESLLGLLDNTVTGMGARLVRMNVLQPSTEGEVLEKRLDAVEELTKGEDMFFAGREALKGMPDMDRLCTQLITTPVKASLKHSEQSINNVIILKQAVGCIPPVFKALGPARSLLLMQIRELCNPIKIQPVLDLINEVINEDIAYSKSPLDLRNQRCYAVKSGVNGLLDVARQTYKEATEDVHTLLENLAKETEFALELRFESGRGYYIRLPACDFEDRAFPEVFINIVKRKKFVEFSTLELMKRNAKINDSLTEVLLMSDKTVQQLVSDVGQEVSHLFQVSEAIAMLDMICSFAHLCTIQDYVRPEYTSTLAIKAGRHPIREKIHRDHFVPNDVYASPQSRFQIITGCNMSGKSTYLRSILLMAIMAQIGSFVPASYASFPLSTHLFARISSDDSISSTISTFAAEMREMAFILANVSPKALIIVDELGRGTSSRDGIAIALAICEKLIQSRAMVWFATHFRDLAEILSARAGVVGLHMRVDRKETGDMTMLYKIADGNVKDKHYGLAIAAFAGLPERVLIRAKEVAEELEGRKERGKRSCEAWKRERRRKLVLRLRETLKMAVEGGMGEEALRVWVKGVQEEFVKRMEALEESDDENEEEGDEEMEGTVEDEDQEEDHDMEM